MKASGKVDVEVDPRSPDFGKARIGNTRYDMLGGFGQYLRLGAQIGTQSTISSTTGKKTKLGSGFGERRSTDVLVGFLKISRTLSHRLLPKLSTVVTS